MANVYFDAVNWVYDTLRTAAASAPFTAYDKPLLAANVMLGLEPTRPLQNRTPCVLIKIPDRDGEWTSEEWAALAGTHGGQLPILVQCACHPAHATYVYGMTGKVGILTLVADVMNALENATNGLRLGGTALGVRTNWRMNTVTDSALYVAEIALLAQVRFSAGQR